MGRDRAKKAIGSEAERIVEEAALILAGWPGTFHAALEMAGGGHATSDVNLDARFGPAYRRIMHTAYGPLSFVAAELRAHAASGFPAQKLDAPSGDVLVPLRKARLAMGLSYQTAQRLVFRGALRVEKRRMGKWIRLLVRPDEFAAAVESLGLDVDFTTVKQNRDALPRKEVERLLSVGPRAVEDMATLGLLGERVSVGFRQFITRQAVERLLTRVDGLTGTATTFRLARPGEFTPSLFAIISEYSVAEVVDALLMSGASPACMVPGSAGLARYAFRRADIVAALMQAAKKSGQSILLQE
ncbi:hypothetical protein [Paracraurococcus lichenis]|uniref:Uncharacterized protein n=1 Tax=Paracraurococcus lichenis TaxID=3064888 RepID=A0ABT9EDA4_9PROT|nr:hypothetical protein [Paracraurococcus sp. LOR1-02]MDO9714189.1 hypothetical protein [Paracraurococcus sp. LOR1-02]